MSDSTHNRYVALLRGINVGGRHKLPMKSLVAIFEQSGCAQVKTYIQSGNVVFSADEELARQIPRVIAEAIAEQFGFSVPVVMRSAAELRRAVASNPFLDTTEDPKTLHVAFLADEPNADRVSQLDPNRSPPDEFALLGSEIYLRCPGGLARTKLTNAYFDSKLSTTSTMRNWKTTLKLLEMTIA